MKFIVSSSYLLHQLQTTGTILSNKNMLPILDCFLFDLEKNSLEITASDMETTVSTKIKVESSSTGKVAIPARMLLDVLKTFPEHPLIFAVNEKTYAVSISSDYGKYQLSGNTPAEYPNVPDNKKEATFDLHAGFLLEALNKTLFATGNDYLRPVLSGVLFDMTKEHLVVVATDAHRMVTYTNREIQGDRKLNSFVLPKRTLLLLKNILKNEDIRIGISYNKSHAFLEYENHYIVCRMIDDKYPNYQAVIPIDNPKKLIVNTKLLLSAVRRVGLFSEKQSRLLKFELKEDKLTVSAENKDYSNEAAELLACTYRGDDMEIGFNATYLTNVLSNLETEEVQITMSVPNKAVLILPAEKDNKLQGDLLMLLMPLMIV